MSCTSTALRGSALAALLASILTTPIHAPRAQEPASIAWRTDFEAARAEATAARSPLWVQFTGSWCGYCVKMERDVFSHPDIVKIGNERFIPVKLQADVYAELAAAHGLEGLPATVLIAPSGRVVAKNEGYIEVEELAKMLAQAAPEPAIRVAEARPGESTQPVGDAVAASSRTTTLKVADRAAAGRPGKKPPLDVDAERTQAELQTRPAVGGFCPVALVRDRTLIAGSDTIQAEFEGMIYRFSTAERRAVFLANPLRYVPVDRGRCSVRWIDDGEAIEGDPRCGAIYRDRLFLFADAQSRDCFFSKAARYCDAMSPRSPAEYSPKIARNRPAIAGSNAQNPAVAR